MTPLILQTTCEHELWAGFFGIDERGSQPECGQVVTVEIDDEDEIDADEDGTIRPCFSVECPRCGGLLEWPQAWQRYAPGGVLAQLQQGL